MNTFHFEKKKGGFMPIFEYRCLQCEVVQEFFLRNQEAEPTCCPLCRGELVKLVSASSFALKGSGWYATDYTQKSGVSNKGVCSQGSSCESTAS